MVYQAFQCIRILLNGFPVLSHPIPELDSCLRDERGAAQRSEANDSLGSAEQVFIVELECYQFDV